MKKINEELNASLNECVRNEIAMPETWEDKEWVIWDEDDGEYWYTVLDETEHPSDDNIIEGNAGGRFYLDRENACDQWGKNVGTISLDNGLTYKTVGELDNADIANIMKHIEAHNPKWFPEINALCEDLSGCYDNDREWLEEFMRRLCQPYVI